MYPGVVSLVKCRRLRRAGQAARTAK